MTDLMQLIAANRARMLAFLKTTHGRECPVWEAYSIPARTPEGRPTKMAGEGCSAHHIFISK